MKKVILVIGLICSAGLLNASETTVQTEKNETVKVDISVTEKGFEPSTINVKPGASVVLNITRKTDATCATQVQVPSKKIKKDLPLNQMVSVDIGKVKKGEIAFGCGMNMMVAARIIVN